MRKIVACLFVSVDGVVGEPEDWLAMSDDVAASVAARAASTDTILLGRVTYEQFAGEWPDRSGALADFINTTHKVVISTSLDEVDWHHTDLIDGNALIGEELVRLRHVPGMDILVLGSATLVQSLLRRAMIDELVLLVHPLIKGRGRRLFDELKGDVPVRPTQCVTFDSGLVSLRYELNTRATEEDTMYTTHEPGVRELDHRVNDGIDVKLLWNSLTDRVSVAVADVRTGEFFELDVDPEDALIAFDHPYAYAHRGWVDRALAA